MVVLPLTTIILMKKIITRLVLTIGMKREMIGQLMLAMVLGPLLEWVILIHPVLISPWVQFMYSLAAQCICMKIQILGEPGIYNVKKGIIYFLTFSGRNIMRDLFQTINILQIMVLFLDLNHSNADVTTQLIVSQKMAMKLFFNMTTKRAKHPSH